MILAVVIVSWNTRDLLANCIQSILSELASLKTDSVVYVIDNNSSDGSASMVAQKFPSVRLIANQKNVGFGAANNQILNTVTADYYLLLNPDTEVLPGAIAVLMEFLERKPQSGVVAPQLLNPNGTIQRFCRAFPTFFDILFEFLGLSALFPNAKRLRRYKMLDFSFAETAQVDQPGGACLLIRGKTLAQVGTFDEQFFMLFEEVDLCYRIKQAGWEIWYTPEAQVVHHLGQSIRQVKAKMILNSHKGLYIFWKKHHTPGMLTVIRPVLFVGLMVLAGVRIMLYQVAGTRKVVTK